MDYDVIIIGGGPGGSTAGSVFALGGRRVLILERERFPRFHIGESLIPCGNDIFQEIGVWDKLVNGGFMPKYGAEFVTSNSASAIRFRFGRFLPERYALTFQVERSRFDKLLLDHAESLGCDVRQEATVKHADVGEDGVSVTCDHGGSEHRFSARWLIDASGRDSFLGRQLNLPRTDLGMPKKLAAFAHFTGVERQPGPEGGNIIVVRLEGGWFWIIPLDEQKTSVGLVQSLDRLRATGLKPEEAFAQAIGSSSELRRRMAGAERVSDFGFAGDYSFRHLQCAGPRWFLAGDAAGFIDPVFSSGVMLALKSGRLAARMAMEADGSGGPLAARAQARYSRELGRMCTQFLRMIRMFYDNRSFEVFMTPDPPKAMARAISHLVGGDTELSWRLRFNLEQFYAVCALQRRMSIVPRLDYRERGEPAAVEPAAAGS